MLVGWQWLETKPTCPVVRTAAARASCARTRTHTFSIPPELAQPRPLLRRARYTASDVAALKAALGLANRGREETEMNAPASFICPITQELMEEPCVTQDGQTYERHAIEYWLKDHDTSPLTGQPLAHKELTANLVLRGMIREWRGTAAP